MIAIKNERSRDPAFVIFIIIGIILTSFAWLGDIVSWAWLGNGFTLDIILAFVAIILTVILIIMWRNPDKTTRVVFGRSTPNRELDDDSEYYLDESELKGKISSVTKEIGKTAQYDVFKHHQTTQDEQFEKELGLPTAIDLSENDLVVFTCPACGEVIGAYDDNCPACGSERPVCIVCLSKLGADDSIVRTPCCCTYAHKEHLINWLKIKGTCPQCGQKINTFDLNLVIFEISDT